LLALFLFSGQGFCQGRDVLKKARKQYDEFMSKVKDLKIVSVVEMGTSENQMKSTITSYKKGSKSRVEMKMEMPKTVGGPSLMGEMKTVLLDDGSNVYMTGAGMPMRKLTPTEAAQYAREDDWWEMIPDSARVVGEEKYGGRDCYVVEIDMGPSLSKAKMWLDKKDLVPIGGEGFTAGKQLRWVHSDFRETKGWKFPYKTEFYVGDDIAMTATVQSIEVDTGLPDDLFDPSKLSRGSMPGMEEMRKRLEGGQ